MSLCTDAMDIDYFNRTSCSNYTNVVTQLQCIDYNKEKVQVIIKYSNVWL